MSGEIKQIILDDLVPSDYNPRRISLREKNNLKNSLEEFGLVDPIIVNLKNNNIIGGHQRFDILYTEDPMKEVYMLELGDIGWVITDTDLKIKDEDHEKALNLALNRITGEFDIPKLNIILEDLIDLGLSDITGFDIGLDDIEYDIKEVPKKEPVPMKEEPLTKAQINNERKFNELKEKTKAEQDKVDNIVSKQKTHFVRENDAFKIRNNFILYKDYSKKEINEYIDKYYVPLDLDGEDAKLVKIKSFNLNIYAKKDNSLESIEDVLRKVNGKEDIIKL